MTSLDQARAEQVMSLIIRRHRDAKGVFKAMLMAIRTQSWPPTEGTLSRYLQWNEFTFVGNTFVMSLALDTGLIVEPSTLVRALPVTRQGIVKSRGWAAPEIPSAMTTTLKSFFKMVIRL